MLVLTRQTGETLVVTDEETGEQITITLLEHRGSQTRLGIQASERFKILRGELLDREPLAEATGPR